MSSVLVIDLTSATAERCVLDWNLDDGPLPIAMARYLLKTPQQPFVVIGRGPLAGAPVVGAQVATIIGRSPITGALTEAKVEGPLAKGLRACGLDAVCVRGYSSGPVSLRVSGDDDTISVDWSDAAGYAKEGVFDTDARLRTHTDDIVVTTGQWGMDQNPAASIVVNCGFPTSQGGLGALCGQMRLKAVVIIHRDRGEIPSTLQHEITEGYASRIDANPLAASERDYPGFGLWPSEGALGYAGSGGFSGRATAGLVDFNAQAFMAYAADSGANACPGCPQSCLKSFLPDAHTPVDGGRVHQLGIAALATQSGISDPATLVAFNALCHNWGVEHLAAEEALRASGYTGGALEPALSAALLDHPLGSGMDQRVKGMAIPPFDPRANQGLGVGYALNPTGPRYDVLEHDIDFDPDGVGPERSEVGRDWGIPEGGLPLGSLDGRRHESIGRLWLLWSGLDALGLCEYAAPPTRELSVNDVCALAGERFGVTVTPWQIERWGAIRLAALRDANAQLGVGPGADWLPENFFTTPLPEGPLAGAVIDPGAFSDALDYVRSVLGWTEHGVTEQMATQLAASDEALREQLDRTTQGVGV